jgi:hypothetical protein
MSVEVVAKSLGELGGHVQAARECPGDCNARVYPGEVLIAQGSPGVAKLIANADGPR